MFLPAISRGADADDALTHDGDLEVYDGESGGFGGEMMVAATAATMLMMVIVR